MIDQKIKKFENPIRLAELNPKETLLKAGFKENAVLCDVGAGTGIFSIPAAKIKGSTVYALEISEDMIALLEQRKNEQALENLHIKKVNGSDLPLTQDLCDLVIMVTVLHEIEDKASLLSELKRILKKDGSVLFIEFHKRETPMGPPIGHRLSEEDILGLCSANGFEVADQFTLGENLYAIVAKLL